MADVSVIYCRQEAALERGWPIPNLDYSTRHKVTIGVSAVSSNAAPDGCYMVRLSGDGAFKFTVDDPSMSPADTNSAYLAAGVVEYVRCEPGMVVSIIQP